MSVISLARALVPASLVLVVAASAVADVHDVAEARDRVSMGGDVVVRRGERVRDAVALGGDLRIEGVVEGSAVAMGGDLTITDTATVLGDVTSMGGDLTVAPGARIEGAFVELGGAGPMIRGHGATAGPAAWAATDAVGPESAIVGIARSAAQWAVLLVLAWLLMGLAPERVDVMAGAIARRPIASLVGGVVVAVACATGAIVLVLTVIGIPAAAVVAVAAVGASYAGLAVSARVIGGVLPIGWLRDRPAAQIAGGVAALFVASLVPWIGDAIVVGAALLGLGAAWQTRFGRGTVEPASKGAGPYRSVEA